MRVKNNDPMYGAVAFLVAAIVVGAAAPTEAATTPSPSPSPSPSAARHRCGLLFLGTEETITNSPCTVLTDRFDLETTYTNTVTTGPDASGQVEYPQALLRMGTLNPNLDFEITFPGYTRISGDGAPYGGTSDVGLAAKYQLASSDWAAYAVRAGFTFPTGTNAVSVSAGNSQFLSDIDWAYTLSERFSISGTLSFNARSEVTSPGVARSYFNFEPSVLASFALSSSSQVSAEYAYASAYSPGTGGYSTIDVNLQYALGPRLSIQSDYGFSPSLPVGGRSHSIDVGLSVLGSQ